MIWTLHQAVLALHILLAITWVGGVLFVAWGVFPASHILTYENQRLFLQKMMKNTHWILTSIGIGVIASGIMLGTLLGPIRSYDTLFGTPYGQKWLTAIIVGIITLIWGVVVGYREAMKLFANKQLWTEAERGNKQALENALFKMASLESVEVIGFIALIFIMISF